MKTNTTDERDPSCELTQFSISEAIDANKSLKQADALHIESCAECAQFHQLWHPKSPVTAIASGSLIEQLNLSQPIISQLQQDSKIIALNEHNVTRSKFFTLSSIAAVLAIASITAFTFFEVDQEKTTITQVQTTESNLELKIPKLNLTLTEAEIEKSLEENFQNISDSATVKWKSATTGMARATEYIANGTHYISSKYLTPKNDGSIGPQSQLEPQQDEPNPLQYG